jgi:hypothetical protein
MPPLSGGEREQLEQNLLRYGCCSQPVDAIVSLLATTLERVFAGARLVKFP